MAVVNKKAQHDYFLLDRFEVGIILTGAEVKSLKEGSASLTDSFVKIINDEPVLMNAYISPYKFASNPSYEPRKERKLLMHKKEVDFLKGKLASANLTIVPVKVYNKRNLVKLEIALARAKKKFDKRAILKKKAIMRDAEAEVREAKLKAQRETK